MTPQIAWPTKRPPRYDEQLHRLDWHGGRFTQSLTKVLWVPSWLSGGHLTFYHPNPPEAAFQGLNPLRLRQMNQTGGGYSLFTIDEHLEEDRLHFLRRALRRPLIPQKDQGGYELWSMLLTDRQLCPRGMERMWACWLAPNENGGSRPFLVTPASEPAPPQGVHHPYILAFTVYAHDSWEAERLCKRRIRQ